MHTTRLYRSLFISWRWTCFVISVYFVTEESSLQHSHYFCYSWILIILSWLFPHHISRQMLPFIPEQLADVGDQMISQMCYVNYPSISRLNDSSCNSKSLLVIFIRVLHLSCVRSTDKDRNDRVFKYDIRAIALKNLYQIWNQTLSMWKPYTSTKILYHLSLPIEI